MTESYMHHVSPEQCSGCLYVPGAAYFVTDHSEELPVLIVSCGCGHLVLKPLIV